MSVLILIIFNCNITDFLFTKLNDITKCKVEFKMAETLAIIPLWYGMVWCGGAEQFFCFEFFYIEVRLTKISQIEY